MEKFEYRIYFYEVTDPGMTVQEIAKMARYGKLPKLWESNELIVPSKGDFVDCCDDNWKHSFYEVLFVMYSQGNRYSSGIWDDETRKSKCIDGADVYVKKI